MALYYVFLLYRSNGSNYVILGSEVLMHVDGELSTSRRKHQLE